MTIASVPKFLPDSLISLRVHLTVLQTNFKKNISIRQLKAGPISIVKKLLK